MDNTELYLAAEKYAEKMKRIRLQAMTNCSLKPKDYHMEAFIAGFQLCESINDQNSESKLTLHDVSNNEERVAVCDNCDSKNTVTMPCGSIYCYDCHAFNKQTDC